MITKNLQILGLQFRISKVFLTVGQNNFGNKIPILPYFCFDSYQVLLDAIECSGGKDERVRRVPKVLQPRLWQGSCSVYFYFCTILKIGNVIINKALKMHTVVKIFNCVSRILFLPHFLDLSFVLSSKRSICWSQDPYNWYVGLVLMQFKNFTWK